MTFLLLKYILQILSHHYAYVGGKGQALAIRLYDPRDFIGVIAFPSGGIKALEVVFPVESIEGRKGNFEACIVPDVCPGKR